MSNLESSLRLAISDPGAVAGRRLDPSWGPGHDGYAEQAETIQDWQWRAVITVLSAPSGLLDQIERLTDIVEASIADLTKGAWRDYTFEPHSEGGVAVLCRSDDMCMEAEINRDGYYLTLGEAYDWTQQHIAGHAALDAEEERLDRSVETLHAAVLAAEPGPWRWELRIAGRFDSWTVHRWSTLAACDNPDRLARLVADSHLENRPADLVDVPWCVLVWPADVVELAAETAVARVTSEGMHLVQAFGAGGLAPTELPRVNSAPVDAETCGSCASGKCHGAEGDGEELDDTCGCALHNISTRDQETGELLPEVAARLARCCGDHDPATCPIAGPGAECCTECPAKAGAR